jgi:pentalenolactone synthase
VTRSPNPHQSFGYGPHFCIGAPLARLELQVLFGTLVDRFPAFTLAVPVERLQSRSTLLTGGLSTLPIAW